MSECEREREREREGRTEREREKERISTAILYRKVLFEREAYVYVWVCVYVCGCISDSMCVSVCKGMQFFML